MAFSEKTPPAFDKNKDDYSKWKRKFEVWQSITDVVNTKQGGLLALRLDEVTQGEVLEAISTADLKKEDGATRVITFLNGKFPEDNALTAFEAYEDFEKYKRPENVSISEYCAEFERKLAKVKAKGTTVTNEVLAYRLLNSANITPSQEQLIKATITTMDYESMATQLKKVFKGINASSQELEVNIKEEPEDVMHNETLYGARSYDSNRRQGYEDRGFNRNTDSGYSGQRGSPDAQPKQKLGKGKNPLDEFGNVTRCLVCESINHWKRYCPDRVKENKTYSVVSVERDCDKTISHSDGDFIYEISSVQRKITNHSDDDFICEISSSTTSGVNPEGVENIHLSCDTINAAVIDTGAPKTVCGSINQRI